MVCVSKIFSYLIFALLGEFEIFNKENLPNNDSTSHLSVELNTKLDSSYPKD